MEQKRNSKIQLSRQLNAIERIQFGARPTIGRNTYIVPTDKIDALMAHLNNHHASGATPNGDNHRGEDVPTQQEEATQTADGGKQETDSDAGGQNNPSNGGGEQSDEKSESGEQPQKEEQSEDGQSQSEQEQPHEEEKPSVKHEKFDDVMAILQAGEAVYLYGPAGTGKNHLCAEIAKALGVEFYFTNCIQDVFQLKGFVDAKGEFQKTQLYQAYTEGGLFMLDEMDASDPSAAITMNALLANGYMEFPGHTERIFPHPNFKVIACGNTIGKGADEVYAGRLVLDGATLDRFTVVPVNYDERVELSIAQGDTELVQFCRKLRDVAKEMQYNTIISYRTITRLTKYIKIFDVKKTLEYGLTNAMAEDDAVALSGAFAKAKDRFGKTFYQMFNR